MEPWDVIYYEAEHGHCPSDDFLEPRRSRRRGHDPDAEATVPHELAHVQLDHDNDPDYVSAETRDRMDGTDRERGPWEIDADALAAAMAEALSGELTSRAETLGFLAEDAARYD